MGLSLGFVQDLFSAGGVWFNLVTKGLVGLLAGLMGRQLANATPTVVSGILLTVSLTLSLLYLLWGWSGEGLTNAWFEVRMVLLPQAMYDAVLGALAYWLVIRRAGKGRDFEGGRLPFVR